MITVYPLGTTIYDPDKSYGGYTLIDFLGEPEIILIDMNGNIVHQWDLPEKSGISNYIHLLDNDNLLGSKEWDWDGRAVWEPPVKGSGAGLSKRQANGNTIYSYRDDLHLEDYSIWEGWEMRGWPVTTVLRGKDMVEDGRLLGSSPSDGQLVPRKLAP